MGIWDSENSGGGGTPSADIDYIIRVPAGAHDYDPTNYPDYSKTALTNGTQRGIEFDDTTEQFIEFDDVIDSDVGTVGTVEIYGMAKTWVTGKNTGFKIYASPAGSDVDIDIAYTAQASGAKAISATGQDYQDVISFAIDTTAWAGKKVRFKLSRDTSVADNLSGNYIVFYAVINIPRA